jgi:hypothetical protein
MTVDVTRGRHGSIERLGAVVGPTSGVIPETNTTWTEAFWFGIDYQRDRIGIALDPTVWIDSNGDEKVARKAKRWLEARQRRHRCSSRARLAARWAQALCGDHGSATLCALGVADGIDATFELAV